MKRIGKQLIIGLALLGLASPAPAEELVITVEGCRDLVRHVAADGVAYQPGVGSDGRRVAPADLAGSSYGVVTPERVVIDLTILLRRFLADPPPFTETAEVKAGLVVVDTKSGQVFYNGQRLGDTANALVAGECRKRFGDRF